MTIRLNCPHCQQVFERETVSKRIECPNCWMVFAPSLPEPQSRSDETGTNQVDLSLDDDLRLEPIAALDGDDGTLRVRREETNDQSIANRQAARHLLAAAREKQASREQSQREETVLDKLTGQSQSSSRHFRTVIVGVGVMFGGLMGLASVAGHFAKGRTGITLPVLFMIIAAAGICVITYGIFRGLIDMLGGKR